MFHTSADITYVLHSKYDLNLIEDAINVSSDYHYLQLENKMKLCVVLLRVMILKGSG